MALSGQTTWTLNREQVIAGALRKLGVLPSGGAPTSDQTADAAQALNALVKALQADGMPVWSIENFSFNTVAGVDRYEIGPGKTLNTAMPLKVIQAFQTPANGSNIPLNIYTRYDFNRLPDGLNYQGTPVNLYYQPLIESGVITLWPTPQDATTHVDIHYQAPFDDMVTNHNEFDFPSYWNMALIYLLAWTLSPEYGIPPTDRKILESEAKYWKQEALSYGSEEGSLFLQPERN